MTMQEFAEDQDEYLYLARAIWVTMEAHMIMEDFMEPSFGTHIQISSLFTRFLAEETGNNFSSGLSSQLAELKKKIDKSRDEVDLKNKHLTSRLDSLTDNVKKLCTKAEVKYAANANTRGN